MKTIPIALALLMLAAARPTARAGAFDMVDDRSTELQRALERRTFDFDSADATILHSVHYYGWPGDLAMAYDASQPGLLRFSFNLSGKEIVAIDGSVHSVFFCGRAALYFVDCRPGRPGCTVSSHSITTGKLNWTAKLAVIPAAAAADYLNEVRISVHGSGRAGEGVVEIAGRETAGDYIAFLDCATGDLLAKRIFRQPPATRPTTGPAAP